MNNEQRTLVRLRCMEQNFIRHSKTDTSALSINLLERTREKIRETESILEIQKFEEVLINGANKSDK